MWTLTANLSNIKLKKKCLLPYTVCGTKNMACTTGNICFKFEIVKSPVLMTALYRKPSISTCLGVDGSTKREICHNSKNY